MKIIDQIQRYFALKIARNSKRICTFPKELTEAYALSSQKYLNHIYSIIPNSSASFLETSINISMDSAKDYSSILRKTLDRVQSVNCITPRDVLALGKAMEFVSGFGKKRYITKLENAYEEIKKKAWLLNAEDIKILCDCFKEINEEDVIFDYKKDIANSILIQYLQYELSTNIKFKDNKRISQDLMKCLNLPKHKDIKLEVMITPYRSSVISSLNQNKISIFISEYEPNNPTSLLNAIEIIQKESPNLICLDQRPDEKDQSLMLEEKTFNDHVKKIKEIKEKYKVVETELTVYENIGNIKKISFNESIILRCLDRIKNKNYTKIQCFLYKMKELDEFNYLYNNINYIKSNELYNISKYNRLSNIFEWLSIIKLYNCPICGNNIDKPPNIWNYNIAEADFSNNYQRYYTIKNIFDYINKEKKYNVLLFTNSNNYLLYINDIYYYLYGKNNFNINYPYIKNLNLKDDIKKAAEISIAFNLPK